jgi:hypothetical protein
MKSHIVIDKGTVVLQSCMDLLKIVPGSYSETYHDGNQVINVKVEDVTRTQEEGNPVPITFPVIKAEHEVSCMSVYV